MPPLKVRFAVPEFHRRQFAPQYPHQEVAAPACRLQEARIDTLRLVLHQIQHRLHHPHRSKHLPMICHTLF